MKQFQPTRQAIGLFGLCLVISSIAWNAELSGQQPELNGKGKSQSTGLAQGDLFPQEVEVWIKDKLRIEQGMREANQLRLRLLSSAAPQNHPLERIAETIAGLQAALKRKELSKLSIPIADFDCSVDRLTRQLSGRDALPMDLFSKFDGRWFGKWGDSEVNHDWRPTKRYERPVFFSDSAVHLSAQQYAWISNGFGWNYLAAVDASNRSHYVLGMVYYFSPPDFQKITDSKAHVGFADSPTRLVWITDREIFLEEVFETGDPAKEHYVITAIYHDLFGSQPNVSSIASQATYTRDPGHRPAFRNLKWK